MICKECKIDKSSNFYYGRSRVCKECQKAKRSMKRREERKEVYNEDIGSIEVELDKLIVKSNKDKVKEEEEVVIVDIEKVIIEGCKRLTRQGSRGKTLREFQAKSRDFYNTHKDDIPRVVSYIETLEVCVGQSFMGEVVSDAEDKLKRIIAG